VKEKTNVAKKGGAKKGRKRHDGQFLQKGRPVHRGGKKNKEGPAGARGRTGTTNGCRGTNQRITQLEVKKKGGGGTQTERGP